MPKLGEVIEIKFDNLDKIKDYNSMDNSRKSHYFIELFTKFLSFSSLHQSKVNLFSANPTKEETDENVKKWESLKSFIATTNCLLNNYIKSFVKEVLKFSKVFSTAEGDNKEQIADILMSIYHFSVYSSF